MPAALETVDWEMPVEWLRTTTFAPGMMAPVGSVTVPLMPPRPAWANAWADKAIYSRRRKAIRQQRGSWGRLVVMASLKKVQFKRLNFLDCYCRMIANACQEKFNGHLGQAKTFIRGGAQRPCKVYFCIGFSFTEDSDPGELVPEN
jgi:hypothetical protein